MKKITGLAVAVALGGGVSLLGAEESGNKQVCYAKYTATGCVQVDCAEECSGWTELESFCQNNVFSCKGVPPAP